MINLNINKDSVKMQIGNRMITIGQAKQEIEHYYRDVKAKNPNGAASNYHHVARMLDFLEGNGVPTDWEGTTIEWQRLTNLLWNVARR